MNRAGLLCCLLMITMLSSACGSASPSSSVVARTAEFDLVENDVQAREDESNDYSPASVGQVLYTRGQARTGEESRAKLDILPEESIVRLGPNTSFTLSELADQADDFFTRLEMDSGQLWIVLNGGELEVETSVGTASVRGSLMGVSYDPDLHVMTATCMEGECSLANLLGTTAFTAGQAADIPGLDLAPSVARPMTQQEYELWLTILRELRVSPRLGDRFWLDMDVDGIQDPDEKGVKDALVSLFNHQGFLVGETRTDEEGYYSFPFLKTGIYYLVFETLADYAFTWKDAGHDDKMDSDADPATGQTVTFLYVRGEQTLNWDAGVVPMELAPTPTATNTPEVTPTAIAKIIPPCTCYTSGVTFQIVFYDGSPGWSDCGEATACHSIIGDQTVASGTVITAGSYCSMKVICP